MTMNLSCTDTEIRGFKDFGVTSLTFWGHVTSSVICGFLLVVHCNHASILHRYGYMGPQTYRGHDFDLLGSRDVIDHVTIGLGVSTFLLVMTMRLSCTYTEIRGFKDFGVTSLT